VKDDVKTTVSRSHNGSLWGEDLSEGPTQLGMNRLEVCRTRHCGCLSHSDIEEGSELLRISTRQSYVMAEIQPCPLCRCTGINASLCPKVTPVAPFTGGNLGLCAAMARKRLAATEADGLT